MFGGVHDIEESEDGIESEFFDQLFALNLERNRFFPLALKRARAASKKQADDRATKRSKGKANEEELLRNLAALETRGNVTDSVAIDLELDQEAEDPPTRSNKPILSAMPHPRFNAQLAVQGDTLYIFGGTYEHGDREYTFDEMYAIDLGKLDGVQEIYRREPENWQGDDDESESESVEGYESSDEDMEDGTTSGVALPSTESFTNPTEELVAEDEEAGLTDERSDFTVTDTRPHPRAFESLREFFARTSNTWQETLLRRLQSDATNSSIKELRKLAFDLAEKKWWDSREEVIAEEERLDEAGIGEIVNVAERTNAGGPNKRR